MKEKILIISGDPNSINSEIIFKSWKKVKNSIKKKIYVISNLNLLQNQFKRLKYRIQLTKVNSVDENIKSNKLKIIDIDLKFKKPFDVSQKLSSNFVIDCLNYGHWLANNKKIKGIINCAIDKKLLNKKKIGVTEYLASKCKIKDNSEAMLICNDKFAVCPLTTHLDIKDIPKKINQKLIISKIRTIDLNYKKLFKKKPKIGILGLNPHNAELRNESEEKKIIIPSIRKLRKLQINAIGPLVADTVFINDYKKFDIIVGMFHDQVLAPFKTIYKFDAINMTLGLNYLRVSPDHGTAKELIGKNKADPISLIKCINFINKFGK